jgi:hypothetical protein
LEQNGQSVQNAQSMKKWIIILLIVVCLLLVGVVALFLNNRGPQPQQSVSVNSGETPKLAYAEGVTVVEDPDALQKAVDDMYAQAREGGVALEYKNSASSTDGETFSCYIANAARNTYDMYIDIYSDAELTDEIFLSGLLRPGSAFDNIQLNKKLEPGTHTVYVGFTQVEEDLTTIHAQVFVTMEFTVAA